MTKHFNYFEMIISLKFKISGTIMTVKPQFDDKLIEEIIEEMLFIERKYAFEQKHAKSARTNEMSAKLNAVLAKVSESVQ